MFALIVIMNLIFIILFATTTFAQNDDAKVDKTPKLIGPHFYRKAEICADAKIRNPEAQMAVILMKTHLCDVGTEVCMDSLSTFADPANVFLRENFALYHTRFYSYQLEKTPVGNKIIKNGYPEEKLIRDELGKQDSDPELLVLDLKTCQSMGSKYMMTDEKAFGGDFLDRYAAIKRLLISIPGVKDRLLVNGISEIFSVSKIRLSHPEMTMRQAFTLLQRQAEEAEIPEAVIKSFFIENGPSETEMRDHFFILPNKPRGGR